jgi:hypothetical protein
VPANLGGRGWRDACCRPAITHPAARTACIRGLLVLLLRLVLLLLLVLLLRRCGGDHRAATAAAIVGRCRRGYMMRCRRRLGRGS